MDDTYRLEDYFCPACLSGHPPDSPCDGLNYWCTCLCVADHEDVVKARRALRLSEEDKP